MALVAEPGDGEGVGVILVVGDGGGAAAGGAGLAGEGAVVEGLLDGEVGLAAFGEAGAVGSDGGAFGGSHARRDSTC